MLPDYTILVAHAISFVDAKSAAFDVLLGNTQISQAGKLGGRLSSGFNRDA